MDQLTEAVARLTEFLSRHGIRFMLIGGMANAVWGRTRATTDADVVLLLEGRSIAEMVELIGAEFHLLKPNAAEFAKRTYVIPIQATESVNADLSLAMLPYEQQALEHAAIIDIGDAHVPVCRPEDLIIYKAISEREKDWMDIEGVLKRQGDALDQAYILEWLEQFALALERPELVKRYKQLRKTVRGPKTKPVPYKRKRGR